MKQENLNELRNIYLNIATGGEGPEVLNEAPGGKAKFWDSKLGRFVTSVVFKPGTGPESFSPDPALGLGTPTKAAVPVKPVPVKPKVSQYTRKNLGDKQFADFKAGGGDAAVLKGASAGEIVAKGRVAQRPPAGPGGGDSGSSDNDSSGNGSGGPTRPAASGPVLSKLKGVEGTGVGANFKAKAFNDTERTRYSSVAAQNAARTSAASGTTPNQSPSPSSTPSAPTPAVGKLGNTSFERRTPTSAELRAAQGARDKGASPEKALQAAQKTNLLTTGPTTAIPDLKSVNADLAKANSPAVINSPAPAGSALAAQQKLKPPTPPVTQNNSYQWPSAKTIRDIAGAYSSIYEAKKQVDQDEDGDNDFADNMIARMVASGMSREEAIKKVKNKDYNKKDELDEGIGSAIRGLFGKKKEPEAPKPESRGAELRRRYNTGPDKSDTSAKRKILDKTRARAESDKVKYGNSPYTQSVADKSAAEHERYLRAGYNKYGADRSDSGGMGGSGGSGRGSKAAKRAAALNNSYDLYDLIQSHLLEYGFADTEEGANVIIENMSPSWIKQILSED